MWSILAALGTAFLGAIVWGIKKLIIAVFDNTVSLKLLSEKVTQLANGYERMWKVEKDLNELHIKFRNLNQKNGEM